MAYDPDSEYVMSIGIFNKHWEYANTLIYFDQKFEDPLKEQERVTYLKKLTKMFYQPYSTNSTNPYNWKGLTGSEENPTHGAHPSSSPLYPTCK